MLKFKNIWEKSIGNKLFFQIAWKKTAELLGPKGWRNYIVYLYRNKILKV